ncbi:histidine kinase [Paenibacillus sp. LjRoot56]|uniref:sensor histidine kinase n=1 Tax=Paenibacillus sp. LjRoot56 TaxID=3342333 RepID=UPI003ED0FCDA
MERRWLRWPKKSTQVRLTIIFVLTLIPLVGTALYANLKSKDILQNRLMERSQHGLTAVMNYIDLSFQSAEELSLQLANDSDLNMMLSKAGSELEGETLFDFRLITSKLSQIVTLNTMFAHAAILHSYSHTLLTTLGYQRIDQPDQEEWVKQAAASGFADAIFIPSSNRLQSSGQQDPVMNTQNIVLMRLMNFYNQDQPATHNVVLLVLRKSYFANLIRDLLPTSKATVYLYTADKRLVASTGAEMSGESELAKEVIEPRESGSIRWGDQLITQSVSDKSGLSLVLVQPAAEIFHETQQLQTWTVVIIIISLCIAFWSAWVVFIYISKPLRHLVNAMQKMRKGQLVTRITHHREDEFGFVMDSFNQMAQEQQQLIQEGYELQLRLARTELKRLQAQINPHFLYNTLDSIYSAAMLSGEKDIGSMVVNLSKFFRISLGKGREIITVGESVSNLQYYLNLQKLRFRDQLAVETFVSEEAAKRSILRLLLQPLVENAILHGLEKRVGSKLLRIEANVQEGKLIIRINDNGQGISDERLTFIRDKLAQITVGQMFLLAKEQDTPDEIFGLSNVKSRMLLYYGEGADMDIKSNTSGTEVTLIFPREA